MDVFLKDVAGMSQEKDEGSYPKLGWSIQGGLAGMLQEVPASCTKPLQPQVLHGEISFLFRGWEQKSPQGLLWGCSGHRLSKILNPFPMMNLASHLACEQRARGSEARGGWLRGFLDREKKTPS